MKKKTVILLSVIAIALACVSSALTLAMSPKKDLKPSEYNLGQTYEQAVIQKKPMIVVFYSDWCSYCVQSMPKYELLNEVYQDKYNFVMVNTDDPTNLELVKDYAVSGLPTMYITDPSIDNRVFINSALYGNLGAIRKELDRYLRVRAMIK